MTKREYKNGKQSIKRNAKFAKTNTTTRPQHTFDYSGLNDKQRAKLEKKDLKKKFKEQKLALKKMYQNSKKK